MTNHLANETSPYLLQHQHNPVNWYPWGQEALDKASSENKMIIVSIGYAACHWCHVMERESFEDSTVAALMNENFVSIKVDREERPDVDNVYMAACQLTNRSCGWPLNAFALPDGRPVWAGTYFPKENWLEVLQFFAENFKKDLSRLEKQAESLVDGIQAMDLVSPADGEKSFSGRQIGKFADTILDQVDFEKGGFRGAPKFPVPGTFSFLLNYSFHTGDKRAEEAVRTTLDRMADGGIYDHLGGGFARYSVDEKWLAPHFEKMLYDNGQLLSLYAGLYEMASEGKYRDVIDETYEFVVRELSSSEGGFYSSLDADSEGEEGKFYVWTQGEIDKILGPLAGPFSDFYGIQPQGNWEEGKNILHVKTDLKTFASQNNIDPEELASSLREARSKLFEAREERVRPGLDDKIITSWNALMLKGCVDAYAALGDQKYLQTALKNATFIQREMTDGDGKLYRTHKEGVSKIHGFLEDYALVIQAYIDLYQVTFDEQWIEEAHRLAGLVMKHFRDEESGFFYYKADIDDQLVTRQLELPDNVIPGSNSVMAKNLYLLGEYFYSDDYKRQSSALLWNILPRIARDGARFYSNWCDLYLMELHGLYEVAIVGADFSTPHQKMLQHFRPDMVLLGGPKEGNLELLQNKLQDGETYIYVCRNKTCKFPVKTFEEAIEQFNH